MKKRILASVVIGFVASSLVSIAPASADSRCNNGTISANSGRGTCSYNGGVDKRFPSYSEPGSSSYNRNNGYGLGTNSYNRNNGYGLGTNSYNRNNGYGLGTTSTWGNTRSTKRSCSGWNC